jgi:hypothetical protein
MDVEALRQKWMGFAFDTTEFEVRQQDALDFARACGETDPRFVDPTHPDFQAPPTFPSRFVARRVLPRDFPRLGPGTFDAGKSVVPKAPVRPGDVLVAGSLIHDIYEKTGRSGPMVFLVHRMEFSNQKREAVSTVDWRMVLKLGSPK